MRPFTSRSIPAFPAAWILMPLSIDTPWTWITRAVGGLYRWWQDDATRSFMATASLYLIVGGLSILFLVVVLFLLQSAFPHPPEPLAAAKGSRELRRTGPRPNILPPVSPDRPAATVRRRLLEGDVTPTPAVDYILDGVVEAGLGEPRILRDLPGFLRLRLFDCRGCARDPTPGRTCRVEQDKIEAAFAAHYGGGVRVREVQCRAQGDAECDFEVKH